MSVCTGPECVNEAKKKGLCNTHYVQQQRNGPDGLTVIGANVRRKKASPCTFAACDKPNFARGLCAGHAKQEREGRELAPLTRQVPDLPEGAAWCSTCQEAKPISEFSWDAPRNGPKRVCHSCHKWSKTSKTYGLTEEQYRALYESQAGQCGVCRNEIPSHLGEAKSLAGKVSIDHDHITGDVRGILCNSCNVGLGFFKDNPELLDQAAEYLRNSAL